MTEELDIVVIGGGIGGLVAAAYAARAGARVRLVERNALGGRARTQAVGDFRFNQGGHALYWAGELQSSLDELGVALTGGPASLDVGVIVGGRRTTFPVNARTLATTAALRRRGRLALGVFLKRLLVGRGGHRAGQTVAEWLAERRLPPDAADLVRVLIRLSTYVNAPELLDAGAAALQLQRALHGVRYLDGGWQSIVDALTVAARTQGAEIVDHTAVTELEHSARGWSITTSAGELQASSVVLATASPAATARLLDVESGELGEPGSPVRTTCLDLGLAARTRETALLSTDEPLYCSTHMPPARLGPDGSVVVHAMRYLAPDEKLTADAGRRILWAHVRAAGVGEAGADVLEHRYRHEMTTSHGMPLARRGGLAGRPPIVVASRPGAFLAGDWVGAAGMLADASAASGRVAAGLAVAHAARRGARIDAGSRLSA